MAWRACGRFSFWFLTSRVGDEHTLRVPTARDWRPRSRFQVFPSETSRVSETPWFELLNEEDPGLDESIGWSDSCGVVMDLASPFDFVSPLD